MIRPEDIKAVQKDWADAVVAVGGLSGDRAAVVAAAGDALDRLYAFDLGGVLFKPTRAAEKPFRSTRDAALSYFVGGNSDFPEDRGFALNPWTAVRFENHAVRIDGDTAIAMGHYFFTTPEGSELKVEYSIGYRRAPDGNIRIFLHHSSMPFGS